MWLKLDGLHPAGRMTTWPARRSTPAFISQQRHKPGEIEWWWPLRAWSSWWDECSIWMPMRTSWPRRRSQLQRWSRLRRLLQCCTSWRLNFKSQALSVMTSWRRSGLMLGLQGPHMWTQKSGHWSWKRAILLSWLRWKAWRRSWMLKWFPCRFSLQKHSLLGLPRMNLTFWSNKWTMICRSLVSGRQRWHILM